MTMFFWDIETGGKQARQSSILSLAYARGRSEPTPIYAQPVAGTRLYDWASKNVWDKIKALAPGGTEEQLIKNFIHQVDQLPAGSTLAGWNIGYLASRQGPNVPGFDLPYLTTRAGKYGLEDSLRKAVSRHTIRDLGHETSLRIARGVVSRGQPLVDAGIMHASLHEQAVGYVKKAAQVAYDYGVDPNNIEEVARVMGRSGNKYMFSGWKQEDIYKLVTGKTLKGAHEAKFDVLALQELTDVNVDDAFLKRWSRTALENKLISGSVSKPYVDNPLRYYDSLKIASEMEGAHPGIREAVEKGIRERVAASGGRFADVQKGLGISEGYKIWGGSFRGAGLPQFNLSTVKGFIAQHKLLTGVGVAAGLAYTTQIGQWFSGKDDEYNVLEGLPHRGMAGALRKQNTDFGSGYQGLQPVIHITNPSNLANIKKSGLSIDKFQQGQEENNIYATRKRWFESSSINQKQRLGVPAGAILEFNVDPSKTKFAYEKGWKTHTTLLANAPRQLQDIEEVRIPYNVKPEDIWVYEKNLSYGGGSSPYDMLKFGASAFLLYAGLTAKDKSFDIRTKEMFGKYAGVARKAPMAFWLSESVLSLAQDPSKENAARFGLGLVGWETGRRLGTKFASKLIKSHKGLPGVIGHIAAGTLSSVVSSVIPSKDDAYNTITGLPHGGLAEMQRKRLTDFGSGYTGLKEYTKAYEDEKITKEEYRKLVRATKRAQDNEKALLLIKGRTARKILDDQIWWRNPRNINKVHASLVERESIGSFGSYAPWSKELKIGALVDPNDIIQDIYNPLTKGTAGSRAFGAYYSNMFTSPTGVEATVLHEGLHAVWDIDIAKKDQQAFVDEATRQLSSEKPDKNMDIVHLARKSSSYLNMIQGARYLLANDRADDAQPYIEWVANEMFAHRGESQAYHTGLMYRLPENKQLNRITRKYIRWDKDKKRKSISPGMEWFDPKPIIEEELGFFDFLEAKLSASDKILPQDFNIQFSGFDDAYNTIEGLGHGGLAGHLRRLNTDFGSGYQGLVQAFKNVANSAFSSIGKSSVAGEIFSENDSHNNNKTGNNNQILNQLYGLNDEDIDNEIRTKKQFDVFKKLLEKEGKLVGTGHQRILIPKSILTEKEIIDTLGFEEVSVAIPEKGQDRWTSFRSAAHNYHLHSHNKYWTMHYDEHAAATMRVKRAQKKHKDKDPSLGTIVTEFIKGIPHIFHEGIPGAYYYIKGFFTGSEPMAQRLQSELSDRYKKIVNQIGKYTEPGWKSNQGFNSFSGKDDNYNTIEGLSHKGIAGALRKQNTDFGSGYRFFEKAMQAVGATVGPTLSRMVESQKFKNLEKWYAALPENRQKIVNWSITGLGLAPSVGIGYALLSGDDDHHNTIEGLCHEGMAGTLRKHNTDFGSGWDALKALVRSGNIFTKVFRRKETFTSMLASRSFQQSLAQAKPIKELGRGSYGVTHEMETVFRGQKFRFARKTANPGKTLDQKELQTMQQLQEGEFYHSPSVYGFKQNKDRLEQIDMELFQGAAFEKLTKKQMKQHRQKAVKAIKDLETQGFIHSDTHLQNVMLVNTPQGSAVGLIDYGLARQVSEISAKELDIAAARDVLFFKKALHSRRKGLQPREAQFAAFGATNKFEQKAGLISPQPSGSLNIDDAFDDMFAAPVPKPPDPNLVNKNQAAKLKKNQQADLQRQAAEIAWQSGVQGGRKSQVGKAII